MSETAPNTAPETSTPESGAAATAPAQSGTQSNPAVAPIDWKGTKHKVTIDGQDVDVDYEELKAGYQTRKASLQKFQDADRLQKQMTALFARMKDAPEAALEEIFAHPQIGGDFKKVATNYLAKQFEREAMPAEQRELEDARAKIAEFEKREAARTKAEEDAKMAAFRKEYADKIETEILAAADASGLPKNEHTLDRVLFYMRKGLERGYQITAEAASKLVKDDFDRMHRENLAALSPEQLEELLGSDGLTKLEKRRLEKFKQQNHPATIPASPTPQRRDTSDKPKRKETFAEAAERIRQKYGSK